MVVFFVRYALPILVYTAVYLCTWRFSHFSANRIDKRGDLWYSKDNRTVFIRRAGTIRSPQKRDCRAYGSQTKAAFHSLPRIKRYSIHLTQTF